MVCLFSFGEHHVFHIEGVERGIAAQLHMLGTGCNTAQRLQVFAAQKRHHRTIQRSVEDALSEEIIAGKLKIGDKVQANVTNDKLNFTKVLM